MMARRAEVKVDLAKERIEGWEVSNVCFKKRECSLTVQL